MSESLPNAFSAAKAKYYFRFRASRQTVYVDEKKSTRVANVDKSASVGVASSLMLVSVIVSRETLRAWRDAARESHFVVFFSSMPLVPAYFLEIMVAVLAEGFLERDRALELFRRGF